MESLKDFIESRQMLKPLPTPAPQTWEQSTQCDLPKSSKDVATQNNAVDLTAADPSVDQSFFQDNLSGMEFCQMTQIIVLKNELNEQNQIIAKMKAIVKKAGKYEEFYRSLKGKRLKNRAVQVGKTLLAPADKENAKRLPTEEP